MSQLYREIFKKFRSGIGKLKGNYSKIKEILRNLRLKERKIVVSCFDSSQNNLMKIFYENFAC